MSRLSAPLLLVLGLATAPGAVRAAHPFGTDDPGTVGAGVAELELQLLGGRGADCDWKGHLGAGLALHVGLSERLDAGVGFGYEGRPSEHWGLHAPLLDVKWRLLDARGARPGLAVRLDYQPPLVVQGASSGHGLGGVVAASWEAARWGLSANAGLMMEGLWAEAGHGPHGLVALMATRTVARGLQLGGEALWSLDGIRSAGLDLLAALLFDVSGRGALSFGAGPAWRPGHPLGWSLALGWTHAFSGASR